MASCPWLGSITGVLHVLAETRECIDQREDCERALRLRQRQSFLDKPLSKILPAEHFRDFLDIVAKFLGHRLAKHGREAVFPRVATGNEVLHQSADLVESVPDVGRVLPAELDDFDRIPNDVILAYLLKSERLHAERTPPDFAVPNEKARR